MKISHLANAVARRIVPFQPALRQLKRHFLPYEDNPANSDYCITNGIEQIAALRKISFPIENAEVLEFGTGWLPLIPLLFHLAGARNLILTDVARLMDRRTIDRAKLIVSGRLDELATVTGMDADTLRKRLQDPWHYDYIVPWHAASHPAVSVDLIISRTAFEHVPPNQLRHFLNQFHRVLRPSGAMCHVIDNSDHWQHMDRNLSRLNFLRYNDTDWLWRIAQINQQSYQNRLRHSDYQRLFEEAGFTVAQMRGDLDQRSLADLKGLPLSEQFRRKSHEDLAILTSLFVVTKSDSSLLGEGNRNRS